MIALLIIDRLQHSWLNCAFSSLPFFSLIGLMSGGVGRSIDMRSDVKVPFFLTWIEKAQLVLNDCSPVTHCDRAE